MAERPCTVVGSLIFFVASFVFSVVALATPQWIVEDFQGTSKYGLVVECIESLYKNERREQCQRAQDVPGEWQATTAFISIGILLLLCATVATVLSFSRSSFLNYAKWIAFAAAGFFSLASLVFPIGFDGEPVGGKAFKLPEHSNIGFSYIAFIVSLLLIFVGELFAMKILCADF
eukprot:m.481374 g.481374  ORF g.481374 m.481374 type:complete len:175 (+) comp22147_c0_seq1:444-968(+)